MLLATDYYGNRIPDHAFEELINPDSMYVVLDQNDFLGILSCGEDSLLSIDSLGGGNQLNDTTSITTQILDFATAPTGFVDTLIAETLPLNS